MALVVGVFDQIRLLSGGNNSDIHCSVLLLIVGSTYYNDIKYQFNPQEQVYGWLVLEIYRTVQYRHRQHCYFAFLA